MIIDFFGIHMQKLALSKDCGIASVRTNFINPKIPE